MVKVQDQQLSKEDAKALAMRQRFMERTMKFMDSKQRTIGVDKQSLDKQLVEKKLRLEHDKQQNIKEALYLEKKNRYIDEQEKKKETNRMQELLEIRKTLEQQNTQPKNSGGAVANGGPLSMDECGPSSIQQFDGEDNSFSDRKKKQQHQFREWCEQDIALKRKRRMQEKELEKQIASQILEQDQIRCKIALEEEAEQCRQNKLIMVENRHLAEINVKLQEYIKRKEKGAENEETRMICSSPYFCEDICSENRFHQTGDHFKGFSPEKIKEIIQSNSILLKEKQSSKRREIEEEQLWDQMQNRMLHQMEEIEQIKLDAKKEHQKNSIFLTIQNQRKELKKRQMDMERAKFGEIGHGFFEKFGTSCR